MSGPLSDLRVLELAGIGPGPFAAMLLSDMGADVVRVARPGDPSPLQDGYADATLRGRTHVEADLKNEEGRELLRGLAEAADALIEGFRPGVMERFGLGPDELLARNPRLVYGRMTGYGQDGPLAARAGHDINYISIAGVLGAARRENERPMFPLNLIGDYGGGGMMLALGVVSAVLHARSTGQGQVVDASMVEGASLLATLVHGLHGHGLWSDQQGTNLLDSGAHFYEVYETADGRYMAVGALEPQFYAELLKRLELSEADFPQWDRSRWPELKQKLANIFREHTRDQWTEVFEGSDACVTPVLDLFEASEHPHNQLRASFVQLDGAALPAPAPRFSATPSKYADATRASPEEARANWAVASSARSHTADRTPSPAGADSRADC
jgi:alpha-methylacyl-CoA racemase